MDLGIETEAVALAAPYVLGFMGFMYGILIVFTALKWNQSQDVIRNMWTRSLVATPLLFFLFASLIAGESPKPSRWQCEYGLSMSASRHGLGYPVYSRGLVR